MTDILIPLGTGSKFDNIELRFCLRSVEKHLIGVGQIVIVGETLPWLRNIIHISGPEKPGVHFRSENIYRKIIAGCSLRELSDNFLFMNDDHFLLKDFEVSQFPYLHRGPIIPHRIGNEAQERQMSNTVSLLKKLRAETGINLDFKDFDIHCPILYNKEGFIYTFYNTDWPEYGYGIKSVYGNGNFIDGQYCEDLKISQPLDKKTIYKNLEGRDWFSIDDKTLRSGGMQEVLQELYPDKSKYEI